MWPFSTAKTEIVSAEEALPGRAQPMPVPPQHFVLGRPMTPPFPEGARTLLLGMGCFWGAERMFWTLPGVHVTAVGYAGGHTANATYDEVCSGQTGHAEVVLVAYDPDQVPLKTLLKTFWEGHDPTQGMRQGADVGTQYRSCLYLGDAEDRAAAQASRDAYQAALQMGGRSGTITTEIGPMVPFYYAEDYHQQYLAKNPMGYCGHGGTGIKCAI